MSYQHLPKLDLHCHLDGAVRPSTLVALAAEKGLSWPPDAASRCRVAPACNSLHEFLKTFDFFLPALGSRAGLRRAALELCRDMKSDGVIYFEARFAPTLWVDAGFPPEEAVEGALEGLRQGEAETGVKSGLILCGLRNFTPDRTLVAAKLAHRYRDHGVIGLDIAGDERLPLAAHREGFDEARRLGVPITIHAGEAGPASNVLEALDFGATRIGHGVHVVEDPRVLDVAVKRGAVFEMCLTSNVMTHAVDRMAGHPFAKFLRDGVKVTLNTDDPGVQGSTLTQDFERAERELGLGKPELKRAVLNAVDAAFAPESTRASLRARIEEGWR
jgi:adenosine deaminase